jgi:hypothetical protein
MQYTAVKIYKLLKRIRFTIAHFFNQMACKIIFFLNNVSYKKFSTMGLPFVSVSLGGECKSHSAPFIGGQVSCRWPACPAYLFKRVQRNGSKLKDQTQNSNLIHKK